jgi:hypothetical protein
MEDKAKIKAACVVVGCTEKDLLASRLTEGAVVLIVGPVGFKHIVPFGDLAAPPPVTTQVEAEKAPVRAKAKAASKKG